MMTPPFSISARPRLTRAVPCSSLTRSPSPLFERIPGTRVQQPKNEEGRRFQGTSFCNSRGSLEDLDRAEIAVDEVLMVRWRLVVFDDRPQLGEPSRDHDLRVASLPTVTCEGRRVGLPCTR